MGVRYLMTVSGSDDGTVEVHRVNKTFRHQVEGKDLRVLDDLSVSFAGGTFTCVVGPSGCGKSTLLRIIDGLIPPDSGGVMIGGESVREPSLDRGFVFQQFNLLPWRTVQGNVEFGLENLGLKKDERRRRAEEVIKFVALEGFERYYPGQLSGGMQQRVGLARALAVDPSILLMDEPFGSVDDQTRMLLQEELLRIWEGNQKTVVFVTHDIEEALYLADQVVVMGARPSRVTRVIDVPFERPRDDSIRGSVEMGRLKQEIWDELKTGATVEG
jgi:NitT/TauT family transport system ATP-binding protein